jgi:hypothetical protein
VYVYSVVKVQVNPFQERLHMQAAENLVRKQYLISPKQVKKIEALAKKQKTSAAEMVRSAIDAYNPDVPIDLQESELLELVSQRVKEAIADTKETRKRLGKTLQALGVGRD